MRDTGTIIRGANPVDYPQIADLLDRTFGKISYDDRMKLWKWRYNSNPAREDTFPPFLVAEKNSQIVGVHGLIPLRIKTGDNELVTSCSCDLAVDPSAKSAGMKLKLEALSKELSPLHISTSANEPANKITLALGGKEVTFGREKFIKPLRISGLICRKWRRGGTSGRVAAKFFTELLKPADCILSVFNTFRSNKNIDRCKIKEIYKFDDRFDRFWEDFSKEKKISVKRYSSYLNWRYVDYPFSGIQSFELSFKNEMSGFMVTHTSMDEDGLCFVALLEFMGRNDEISVYKQLLDEAIRRSVKIGAHYMVALASTARCKDALQHRGFQSHILNYSPVTYKNNSDIPDQLFKQDSNWYLSLGDGDISHYFESQEKRRN